MRILILSQYWHPENGVPQRRWSWLTEILTSAGHSVEVIAPSPHYKQSISTRSWLKTTFGRASKIEIGRSGEQIDRLNYLPFGTSITGRSLSQGFVGLAMLVKAVRKYRFLREPRPDVIIGTVPALPTSWITMFAAKAVGAPYVIDIRDVWPELLQESRRWKRAVGSRSLREKVLSAGPKQVVIWLVERLITRSLRGADAVITTSERHADYLRMKTGLVQPVATIRNVFPPKSECDARIIDSNSPRPLRVVYAGTVGLAQNLNNVIDAHKLSLEAGTDIDLAIIGGGAAFEALRKRVENEGLDIKIIPQLPSDKLEEFYRWADTALVHLTDWPAFSMAVPSKIFELMSNGIHITAAVEGEAAEIIREHNAGRVVAPECPDQLAHLWDELSRDLSQCAVSTEGRRWVEAERCHRAPESLQWVLSEVSKGFSSALKSESKEDRARE